jgi:50S ribosomal subunit-associated GTPase HflX
VDPFLKSLQQSELHRFACIRAFNKADRVTSENLHRILSEIDGIPISAHDEKTLIPLIEEMERRIQPAAGIVVQEEIHD